MDWKKFNLGVGPMSPEIIDICLEYSKENNYPLMIIPSRNQADVNTGYVFNTQNLINYVINNLNYDSDRILLCRDHCGPYFSNDDFHYSLKDNIERCKKTIKEDIRLGFNLIHIDVSRIPIIDQKNYAHILFEYAISLKNDIMFEFGSEDNNTENISDSLQNLQTQLDIVNEYKNYIVYMVSKTGSLTKHTQVGFFDSDANSKIANILHSNGMLFKEHNADYLTIDDVKLRVCAKIDAVNIAPQLGCAQSEVLYEIAKNNLHFSEFKKFVLSTEFWKKWCTSSIVDDTTKFISSAHYQFNTSLYKQIISTINKKEFLEKLRYKIFSILDIYKNGYNL